MIIVTSGHVDHGKTALLQALTGTHTAHLPEEKKRGMTIDLGYAYLPLEKNGKIDRTLGFIDVPGHEKFLVNMLAGLGGIHYAMLIVAADEGVQAQTLEHLAILRLLQLAHILIVITKADRATSTQIEQLSQQLKANHPVLVNSPVFITSAKTAQGIDELRNYLAKLPNLADSNKPFRYAIDRVFSVKGVGTVVTGTAFSGRVQIDDELLLSNGQTVRIKNIHSQNQQTNVGNAGERLALNLNVDLDRIAIERGDWLLSQKPLPPTSRITVLLNAETTLQESQPIHLYHASARTTGKLNLLQHKTLLPAQQGLAEIILEKPLFLAYADKLILRSGDAKHLVAGAKVIEINSPKRHKRTEQRLDFVYALQQAKTTTERTALYLQNKAVDAQTLMWTEQLNAEQLAEIVATNQQVRFQDWIFNADYQQQQTEKLLTALAQYHQNHNDQLGISKARLYRIATLNQPEKLMYHFIEACLAKGQLQQTRGWLHLPEHKIQFSEDEQALWQTVLAQFEQQHGHPLWVRDLANVLGQDESAMRNFLYKAGKLGYLTPIVKDRFFLTETLYAYSRLVKQFIAEHGAISVNQLRDELQFGRKLVVQLIEYFDRCGFLRRKGNIHVLRDSDVFDL
ncbi:selenocysteine-specific translation elongation factor [Pasteurella multocida]|uniref:selenocysteine-specific translation elongation factor n=1 Tax=Pasteurella multocida TaxID=747 RepID=UPI000DFF2BB7|nr:selenocysteine-specific translation elongation factor [Pasteurella multocida]MCL7786599.1 selenocysteine-specific translation elongation factor [Pasteurella multocida]MCL7796260.1 selenocysteine-specific translation elongation factor [Pasteurella multocida]MCL7817337.1 selenocysteine-specific translation elongation factor [Pasteurella multocida]MEB3458243.1 selenocysteine-specific translation elongation factor [Pasteurella multocida]MEB3484052.1 selenocysteine-specific translation elongatio